MRRTVVSSQVRTEDLLRDLAQLIESLRAIVSGLPSSQPTEMQVWSVYAGTERVVAILKLRMRVESPGVHVVPPKSKSPADLLTGAAEQMAEGIQMVDGRELAQGLESLRAARNNLRTYLSQERRARLRSRRRTSSVRTA